MPLEIRTDEEDQRLTASGDAAAASPAGDLAAIPPDEPAAVPPGNVRAAPTGAMATDPPADRVAIPLCVPAPDPVGDLAAIPPDEPAAGPSGNMRAAAVDTSLPPEGGPLRSRGRPIRDARQCAISRMYNERL